MTPPAPPSYDDGVTGGLPAAGWYHDGRGLRRWDGRAWGPYAPFPAAPPSTTGLDPVVLAALVHRRFFFVRHHSTEALNANLTVLAAYLGYLVAFVVGAATDSPALFIVAGLALFATLAHTAAAIGVLHRADRGTPPA